MTDVPYNKKYPYEDGDFLVIGPECFTRLDDHSVISWRGENYVPQPHPFGRFRGWRSRTWPIRIRCALLMPFSCKWNSWLRDVTASMEGWRKIRDEDQTPSQQDSYPEPWEVPGWYAGE